MQKKRDDLETKIKTDQYENFYNFQQELDSFREFFEVIYTFETFLITKFLERSTD